MSVFEDSYYIEKILNYVQYNCAWQWKKNGYTCEVTVYILYSVIVAILLWNMNMPCILSHGIYKNIYKTVLKI